MHGKGDGANKLVPTSWHAGSNTAVFPKSNNRPLATPAEPSVYTRACGRTDGAGFGAWLPPCTHAIYDDYSRGSRLVWTNKFRYLATMHTVLYRWISCGTACAATSRLRQASSRLRYVGQECTQNKYKVARAWFPLAVRSSLHAWPTFTGSQLRAAAAGKNLNSYCAVTLRCAGIVWIAILWIWLENNHY